MGMHWQTTVELAGRRWGLYFTPMLAYLATQQSLQQWTVLGGGLAFSSLLGVFLLIVTGRAAVRARERGAREAPVVTVVNEAGLVMANDKKVAKPSETIAADAVLQAQPAHPYVSRGGVKLAGALEQYPIDIENHVCLDVGASTGGFTEVLLAGGASLVFAIDVGREQLHPSLRGHPRIVSMEETDIRGFEGKRLPMRPDVVVVDVSFISLKAVLPVALSLAAAPMHLLALIKPQFEAPRRHSKRGIIRNAMVHQEVCDDISAFVASLGCTGIEVFPSSIAGGDGNIEFFIGARRG